MYTIIPLDAVVLDIRDRSESSAVLVVFSQELGKMFVHAQGIRKLAAKHAANVQVGSRVRLDIVRGKHEWRLVGTTPRKGTLLVNQEARRRFGKVAQVVQDLTAVEDPHPAIFTLLDTLRSVEHPKERAHTEAADIGYILEVLGWWVDQRPLGDYQAGRCSLRAFVEAVNKGLQEAYA